MCCFNLITVTYYFGSVTPRPGTETLPRWLSARDDTCVSSLHSQFFSFRLLQCFHFLLFYTLTYCLSPSLSLSITISPLLVPNAYISTQDLLCSSTYIWPSKCVISQQRKWKKVLFKDFAKRFFQHLFMLFSAKAGFLFRCHWRQKQLTSISVMEIWKSGPHLHHLLCFSPFLSRPSPICLITQSHMDAQYVVLIRLQGVATHWGHEGLQQLQIWEKESSSQHKLGEWQPGWVKCVRCTKIFL